MTLCINTKSIESYQITSSLILFPAQNLLGNEGLFCPVCQTRISWMVDDGTGGFVITHPTVTSFLVQNVVQNATYNVTVTYQAAEGCEASSDILFGTFMLNNHCILNYSNTILHL